MASIQYPYASSLSVHSSLWLTPWLRNRFRSTTTVHSSRYYLIAFHISTPTRHRINCDIIGNPIRLLPPLVPSRPQSSSSPSAQTSIILIITIMPSTVVVVRLSTVIIETLSAAGIKSRMRSPVAWPRTCPLKRKIKKEINKISF